VAATETKPAPAAAAPQAQAKKGGRKPGAAVPPQVAQARTRREQTQSDSDEQKVIHFEEGSDPHKIWEFIRGNMAMTSTQIREKLNLGSNIVNTTIYRLKKAGMIRPMSHTAPNGDTLYTSTEFDAKPVEASIPKVVVPFSAAPKEKPEGDVRDLLAALGEIDANEFTQDPDEDSVGDAF
jgi:hypothetical protein